MGLRERVLGPNRDGGGIGEPAAPARALPSARLRARAEAAAWLVGESLVLAQRTLRHYWRAPEIVVFGLLQPVMFLLLFRYVFGGAIDPPGDVAYVDYLMPGILIQTVAMNAVASAIGYADDRQLGTADRLRSLPIARLSVALGRVLASVVHNAFAVAALLAIGLAVGFRPGGSAAGWLAAAALLALFSVACAWIGAVVGQAASTPEGAQAVGFVLAFPVVMGSTAFVPAETMPAGVREFVTHQPFSRVIDAERALMLGEPASPEAWIALAWCAAMLAALAPLAHRLVARDAPA